MNSLLTKSKFLLEIHKSAFPSIKFIGCLRRISYLNINDGQINYLLSATTKAQCLKLLVYSQESKIDRRFPILQPSLLNVSQYHTTCSRCGAKKWQKVRY